MPSLELCTAAEMPMLAQNWCRSRKR